MAEAPLSPHTRLSTSFTSVVSYDTVPSILPERVSRDIERALKEGKLLEVVSVVRETMQTVSRTPLNVAVTGDSGNGMSSFINALRVIGHQEEASAPTGVVRTTQARACYSSPRFPYVLLWDLPGLGATAQSVDSYVDEMQFSQYDLCIVLASEQFSANHLELAKTIEAMGKRFYVVWTKLDRDLSTSVLPQAWLLQNIRENIQGSLQKEGVQEPPIFLVSSFDPLLYDFPMLRDTLQADLSNIRCGGPLKTLSDICEKIINDKVASLKDRVATEHLQDAFGIRDADDLGEGLEAYRLLFGVDYESLCQVAQRTGKLVIEYTAITKSQDLPTLRRGDWKLRFMTCLVGKEFLSFLRYIPCLGIPVVHWVRRMRHTRILELVAQDTNTILRKILKDSVIPA